MHLDPYLSPSLCYTLIVMHIFTSLHCCVKQCPSLTFITLIHFSIPSPSYKHIYSVRSNMTSIKRSRCQQHMKSPSSPGDERGCSDSCVRLILPPPLLFPPLTLSYSSLATSPSIISTGLSPYSHAFCP